MNFNTITTKGILKIQQKEKNMEKYIQILMKCDLFQKIQEHHILQLLNCLHGYRKTYQKDEAIYESGKKVNAIGIVLAGSVSITSLDYFGKRSIQAVFMQGDLFAETYACAFHSVMQVDVIAKEDCEILFVNPQQILQTCTNRCIHHYQMIQNLIQIIAQKNLILQEKLMILSKRSAREKLLCFLDMMSKKKGSNQFTIPFNRNELADYLQCDRSGLSVQLSKLKEEGMIDYHKNEFILRTEI